MVCAKRVTKGAAQSPHCGASLRLTMPNLNFAFGFCILMFCREHIMGLHFRRFRKCDRRKKPQEPVSRRWLQSSVEPKLFSARSQTGLERVGGLAQMQ